MLDPTTVSKGPCEPESIHLFDGIATADIDDGLTLAT